jgi:hypothetical protein
MAMANNFGVGLNNMFGTASNPNGDTNEGAGGGNKSDDDTNDY